MRIIIEINDKDKAMVTQHDQMNSLEAEQGSVIDSGGPEGSNASNYNFGSESLTQQDTINAGEVPNELLELMAGTSTTQTIDQNSINSGAAPNGDL